MTLLTYLINVTGSVDWWTSAAAARDFWAWFTVAAIALVGAIAALGRPRRHHRN